MIKLHQFSCTLNCSNNYAATQGAGLRNMAVHEEMVKTEDTSLHFLLFNQKQWKGRFSAFRRKALRVMLSAL
jgi:hypothetical protein